MDFIVDLLVSSGLSAVEAMRSLAWPFLFFGALALGLRRGALIEDFRRVLRQSVLNVKLFLFNTIVIVPLIIVLAQWFAGFVAERDLTLFAPSFWAEWHPVVVIAASIFVADFVGYWRHRFEHTPLLWPSHAVHHSDEEMTWLTLERFHPVNRMTTFLIDKSVLLLLGVPPYALIANAMVRHYYGFFIHADLPWTYGRASWLFVSPAMHRWHHSKDSRFFNANYATVFSVFDRAFGTYAVPGPCDAPLGITDPVKPTLIGQLAYMLEPRAYRRLADGSATLLRWIDRKEGVVPKENAKAA